jgi:type VI secretion system secreted protein VgrG
MASLLMRLTTPLGDDTLLFRSMSAVEEISRPFEFTVQALSDDGGIAASRLLGQAASVGVELPDGSTRSFHGLVCAMGLDGMDEGQFSYRLVLRPWLWLLTRRSDTRIFQSMGLQDILKQVFQPFSVDYRFDLTGTLPTYEYCVQYRESDFDFVSRLLEQEGIYYFFEHEASKHTLVLTDHPGGHTDCPGQGQVAFRESVDALIELEAITDWRVQQEIQSGQAVLTDYNFTTPQTSLLATSAASRSDASTKLEIYDYPGLYGAKADGDRYAKLRVETAQAGYVRAMGGGSVRALATGRSFTLTDHPAAEQNTKYILLSTRIEARYAGYRSGDGDSSYTCRFVALPASEQYRPPRTTPKPVVQGPQTAVVVGPSGEEIYTDQYGRVKVQFPWDRLGKNDDKSSCWVRVSSPWAGKQWGMIALPRVGQEVVVSFLDGDPDRPLITGRVYNADNMPPYTLPDNATISTIKSRSSKGGADTDFNELRFEDKKGSEYVLLQAQKDYVHLVKNDAKTTIGHDASSVIKGNLHEDVQGEVQRTVAKDSQQKIDGGCELKVAKDMAVDVGGKQGTKTGADLILESGAVLSMKSGADTFAKVGANLGVDAAANVHIKAGANLVIEAGAMITLKAGSSSIVLGPTLSITGSMVMINSGGAPGAGTGASPKTPASPASFDPPEEPKDPISG